MAKQEQLERTPKGTVAPSPASEMGTVQATPVQDTVDEIKRVLGQNQVIYGDQHQPFDVTGETVAQVRSQLEDAWGIEADAEAHLDGEPVKESTVIGQFQELEFVKKSGQKG